MRLFFCIVAVIVMLNGCQQKEYKVGDTIDLNTIELNKTQEQLSEIFNSGSIIVCSKLDSSFKKVIGSVEVSKKNIAFIVPSTIGIGAVILQKDNKMIPLEHICVVK